MANILFINTNCSWNKGSAAQVASAIEAFGETIPNTRFTLISHCPELDSEECLRRDIRAVGYHSRKPRNHREALWVFFYHLTFSLLRSLVWRLLNSISINASFLLDEAYCRAYSGSDVVIDLSGDSFSDKGAFSLINMIGILIALVLKKPVVIYSQSIGPFKKLTLPLARLCLNKARLITVREEISKRYLETIRVSKLIYQVADCAFALSPVTPEKAREILAKEGIRRNNAPLVGISVSGVMASLAEKNTSKLPASENKGNSYFALMAQFIDFLSEDMQAQVVLIPHVIAPSWWLPDDRFICQEIYRLVRNKDNVGFIRHDHTPEEFKGVIGQCDLLIGSRMHANIAALSMCVPTITLGWSHKYRGIMERLGLGEYVCELDTVNLERLLSKVSDAWDKREEIRGLLSSKMKEERESALLGARLVKELMDSLKME